jgi:hypothetical protein
MMVIIIIIIIITIIIIIIIIGRPAVSKVSIIIQIDIPLPIDTVQDLYLRDPTRRRKRERPRHFY